jgi:CHAT domain-containing protein
MAANPTACPSVGELERLLAEALRGQERDSVESHVEACGSCQEKLAHLSEQSFGSASSAAGTASDPEPDEGFLRRLRELSPRTIAASQPLPAADAARFPGGRLGRYEILGRLATGGMGAVFRARHVELGKIVALKVLPAGDLSELSLARFKNEMRAIGRLHHPHIVAAHDAGDIDGVHFLAMDLVDGADLARLVDRHGRLSIADACEAVRQAALGLQHAFEKGLVHRDVKPSNLMLARGGTVQVLDLGLARACEDAPSERLTSKGAILGTADYLAPEQWEHPHAADTRADIYSLGCTLYHLLAGNPPFSGDRYSSILSRLKAHQEDPPPSIAAARPDVPPALAAIVGRMLSKVPAQRFQTPADVAEALRPFTSGANLARLLDATELLPAPDAAATPGPANLETAAGSRRGPASRGRRYRVPLLLAGLAAAIAILAVIFWPKRNAAGPAVGPVAIEDFRVNHYRGKEAKPFGDIRSSPEEIKRRDDVRVYAKLSRPAYCYLIAFNPDGTEQLCHPAFDGSDPAAARQVVPPEVTEFRFFPDDLGYFNLDNAGLQVFVLVTSSKPLPPYAEWRAGVGKPPWRAVYQADGRWQFDGRDFSRLDQDRGNRQERDLVPPALRELAEFFKGLPGLDAVRIVGFPVAADGRAWQLRLLELELARQGRFEEAKVPVRELIALTTQEKGEKHWETGDWRRELDAIDRVAILPEADRTEYVRALRTLDESSRLERLGRYPEAHPLAKEGLDVIGRYLGADDFITARTVMNYATLLRWSGQPAAAEGEYRKALATTRRVVGDDHPVAVAVRLGLASCLDEQDKMAGVRELLAEALEICSRLTGAESAETAIVLNNLGGYHERHVEYRDAESYYRRSLDILVRTSGAEASTTLTTRSNLAGVLTHAGKCTEGESLYREVLAARLKSLPDDHPDVALVRNNLAANLDDQGRHAEAEDLYRTVYDVRRRLFGADNPMTALSGNNLGLNLQYQEKYEEAEGYLVDAVRVFENAGYGRGRQAALAHNNLGGNYRHRGRYAEARQHIELALSILRERLGDGHPAVAECFNNLAATLAAEKKYDEAETVARQSVAAIEKALGDHPLTARARANLANGVHNQGKYAEAGPLLREALDAHRRLLGEGHPWTAWAYKNLITNCWVLGEYEAVAELGPRALASFELARMRSSFSGLGRIGSTDALSPHRHLAAAAVRTGRFRDAWKYLEAGLARGLLDDLSARPLTDDDRAHERDLFVELDRLDGKITPLAARERAWWPGWSARADREELDKLRQERNDAQGRLVKFQSEMAARHGMSAGKVFDLGDIQKALRPDAALVAWLDIAGDPTFHDPTGDHWVCVVRHRGEPVWKRLAGSGPADAWADADDDLPLQVRRLLASRADAAKEEWKGAAARLYRQRLKPIEPALEAHDGLPQVRHLIVLAASRMAGAPVEALVPERLTVSYAPSGSTFARLHGDRPEKTSDGAGARTFLGVADPDFGAAYPPLAATRTEVHAVTRLFTRAEFLLGTGARESTLDRMAADGRLREFRYVHFATHGRLDDERPLASALVLAQEPGSDGRLTAEHVLRNWRLDADLVTLSACETALGKYSLGEGFLGFSQALLLAGARGTLLSLWPVDDRATALLMTRFYENMLGTPDKTVKALPTKAEALAEAKRWLRDLTAGEVERLTADLPRGLPSGTRGVRREASASPPANAPRPFAHPFYWSAFVLIGDSR